MWSGATNSPAMASDTNARRWPASAARPASAALTKPAGRFNFESRTAGFESTQGTPMPDYQLYCFAQSGNAYRAALMLNLIDADWQPVYVDFFKGGETRTPKYRAEVNEMGEVPVLVHGDKKLTQSGVILTYLAERAGKFKPESEDERLEAP